MVAQIASSLASAAALIISVLTAYLTLLSRFKGMVFPKRRVILCQMEGVPCLVLHCEFVNEGAKAGAMEDVVVNMTFMDSGSKVLFEAYLRKDEFSIFDDYRLSDFSTFMGINLGPKQRKGTFLVFRPNEDDFRPKEGEVVLRTSFSFGDEAKKWRDSPTRISLHIEKDAVLEWESATGVPLQIQAKEIGESRIEYLKR